MTRKNKTASEIRPCLSSQEVQRLSRNTERMLRSYEKEGVTAAHGETASGYKRWTFDQAVELSLVRHMRTHGEALPDIAAAARGGHDALVDAAYHASMRSIRENRRALKAIVHLRGTGARAAAVGARDGYYLRYLPQRWCAALPVAENLNGLVDMDDYVAGYASLDDMVSVVGWSPTYTSGTLTSMCADGGRSTTYVYEELASPPMPATTGMLVVDGGCYESACPGQAPGCDLGECGSCSRFGRAPTLLERTQWAEEERRGNVIDRAALPNRLEAPYPAGFWASSSHVGADGRFGAGRPDRGPDGGKQPRSGGDESASAASGKPGAGPGRGGHRIPDSPSVVPRLMPQNCRLPLGVTACVLPAGMYLCRQNDYAERDITFQRLIGVALMLERLEMTPELEVEMSRALQETVAAARDAAGGPDNPPGPYLEPFAAPRGFNGDPAFDGFVQDIPDRDLPRLLLPVRAALAPEDGFVMAHTDIPQGPHPATLRQEMQILVDARAYLAAR